MRADLLIHGLVRLVTCDPARLGLGEIEDASVAFANGQLRYLGPTGGAPDAAEVIDGRGLIALPGLVDPHTHAVWAGSRADEFRQRLAGTSYTDILDAGGGILSTVRETRAATEHDLTKNCRSRLERMRARGVTTVEIKSGYGLHPETEARMLRAARSCRDTVRVITSFLGAHAVPIEYRGERTRYIEQVIDEQLPECAPFADHIDVYCDRGAFTLEESTQILAAGRDAGLKIRAHAEQISHTGIAAAAAAMGATCVDHLERIDEVGIAALAAHGTIAVLLPGAQLYMGDYAPPIAQLRAAGVSMAIGTDLNPGSSPVHDLWTCATLACIVQGLTIPEAILGITRNAGRALGRRDLGWIGPGSVADLAVFRPPPGEPATVDSLIQHLGRADAEVVVRGGIRVV